MICIQIREGVVCGLWASFHKYWHRSHGIFSTSDFQWSVPRPPRTMGRLHRRGFLMRCCLLLHVLIRTLLLESFPDNRWCFPRSRSLRWPREKKQNRGLLRRRRSICIQEHWPPHTSWILKCASACRRRSGDCASARGGTWRVTHKKTKLCDCFLMLWDLFLTPSSGHLCTKTYAGFLQRQSRWLERKV